MQRKSINVCFYSYRYNDNLFRARNFGITKSLLMGTCLGVVTFVMFGAFALAFWYGSKLVRDGEYTAGQIIIVKTILISSDNLSWLNIFLFSVTLICNPFSGIFLCLHWSLFYRTGCP